MAGRDPEPWYRKDRDAWYVTIRGKRHRLASGREGRDKAKAAFHRLMAAEGLVPADSNRRGLKVRDLFDLFLAEATGWSAAASGRSTRSMATSASSSRPPGTSASSTSTN